jgi:hypothetical protein
VPIARPPGGALRATGNPSVLDGEGVRGRRAGPSRDA